VADAIAWVDAIPPEQAVGICGAKMGRLAELVPVGVTLPQGFTVTVDAYRRHCAQAGLDQAIDATFAGLGPQSSPGEIEAAAQIARDTMTSRELDAGLAGLIGDAYQELSARCFDVNVPTAVRRCWASLFSTRAVSYRLRAGIGHRDMPMAVGVIELIHARASGVAFSAHPVTGKTDRIVIETSWGWGEAVVQGLVTPDHIEVGKADGRILSHQVAAKKVVSAFDYAAGQVVEIDMPARLVDRQVLDEEQIAAVVDAVLAVERHYGYPVDVEWVLDRHRRPGDPVCVVQARPVTVVNPVADQAPAEWNPVAMAAKYAFGS
jgi:pyruvate, water dikinase